MSVLGRIRNGVVVLEEGAVLPEGTVVLVQPTDGLVIRVAPVRKREEFPLVKSERPGSLKLSNEEIARILEAEEFEALKGKLGEGS